MAKQRKSRVPPNAALTVQSADGQLIYTFHQNVVETFRRMITNLTYQSGLPRRFAVTAALRKEGVTYSTLALATTLANDLDVNVCAVELNWHFPGIQNQLSLASKNKKKAKTPPHRQERGDVSVALSNSGGLAAVLMGSATLDEVLIPTTLPNLSFLPAGDLPRMHRSVMARSDGLHTYIEHLNQRFDYLILDIPAILATSDAIALASLGDACCIVVQQGVTPIHSVQEALDDIKHLPMLGVVFNQVRVYTPKWLRGLIPQD